MRTHMAQTATQSADASFTSQLIAVMMAVLAGGKAFFEAAEREYDRVVRGATGAAAGLAPDSWESDVRDAGQLLGSMGQVNGFMVMIIGGAALVVGFFVVATIDNALPSISNAQLQSDKNTTLDRIGQALVLGGVVLIVIGVTMVLRTLRSV